MRHFPIFMDLHGRRGLVLGTARPPSGRPEHCGGAAPR